MIHCAWPRHARDDDRRDERAEDAGDEGLLPRLPLVSLHLLCLSRQHTKPTATNEDATFHPVVPNMFENQYSGRLYHVHVR